MKNKKLIIGLSVGLGIILTLIILIFTLFSLSTVQIDFRTSLNNITASEEEIVKSGKFNYKSSVLFSNKKKYINRLEKNNPYLKVINIETKFPNKFIIHAKERQELYAISYDGKYLICDEEFKVLNIVNEYENLQTNAIELDFDCEFEDDIKTGEFLNLKYSIMKNFYSMNLLNNRNYNEIKSIFKKISVFSYKNEKNNKKEVGIKFKTFDDRDVQINNIEFSLEYKLQLFYSVYSSIYDNVGVTDANGKTWTVEELSSAIIFIDNHLITKESPRKKTDVYFLLKLN
ncbi:MAG: FtsQ-type POTRA domain-containing protein [Clostridia bacterium]|nr:FtsQ-type POTRA domain-containing protein [Clostridia bacterium]